MQNRSLVVDRQHIHTIMPEITNSLHVTTRAEWRDWLERNHSDVDEIWLVYYKKHTGLPRVAHGDAVEEALCFGWIDGIIKRIDEDRYTQRFTPRRENSRWSELNIKRAEKMIATGRMNTAGYASVDAAKSRGLWDEPKKAPVDLPVPADLKEALATEEKARENFRNMAPSHRRQYIGWIEEAKREATRLKRIKVTVERLKENVKPGMM